MSEDNGFELALKDARPSAPFTGIYEGCQYVGEVFPDGTCKLAGVDRDLERINFSDMSQITMLKPEGGDARMFVFNSVDRIGKLYTQAQIEGALKQIEKKMGGDAHSYYWDIYNILNLGD